MNKIIENLEAIASQKEMPHKGHAVLIRVLLFAILVIIFGLIIHYAKK